MKRISLLISVIVILLGCLSALNAAATIYGMSGLIETPDDSIASAKTVAPMVTRINDVKPGSVTHGWNLTTFGGAFGVLPNLEVSAVGLDPGPAGWPTETLVNAKYRVLAESVNKPSVTIGIVDMAQRMNHFTEGTITDRSAFVVLGKNLSNVAEGVSGQVSKPLKGTLGFGTGMYQGFFGGLDMSLSPKVSVAVEYLGVGIRDSTTFNGCIRFQPIQALNIEAGALAFESLYVGASYNVSTF